MKSNNKSSICFALIHNNNIQRNEYIKPRLVQLSGALSSKYDVTQIEISAQPKIVLHSVWLAVLRSLMYAKLCREWSKYREIPSPSMLRSLCSVTWINIKKHLFQNKSKSPLQGAKHEDFQHPKGDTQSGGEYTSSDFRVIWRKNSFIETIVTDKHIRAWSAFIETDCEYLICFEDDAVFKDDSMERLCKLFDMFIIRGLNQCLYVDLAGGCKFNNLKISQLQINKIDGFVHYKKPVTNTACVYLLSRPVVAKFLDQLIGQPCLRLIGVDWLMNKLFMLMSKKKFECFCIHAEPSIFKHGSTTGEYLTWQAPT